MRTLTKLCFVSPYLDEDYLRRRYATERFDEVIYPDIEATPKRYAITARNRWIVKNSDFIFFYVNIRFGGAYSALQYARMKNVKNHNFYNLQNWKYRKAIIFYCFGIHKSLHKSTDIILQPTIYDLRCFIYSNTHNTTKKAMYPVNHCWFFQIQTNPIHSVAW